MVIFENIDINIDKAILNNINIDEEILKNFYIDININRKSLRNIDIDKGIIKISITFLPVFTLFWCFFP